MRPRYVILTARITYESSGPSEDLSRGCTQHGNPSKDCGTSKRSAVRSTVGTVRFSGVLRRAQTERYLYKSSVQKVDKKAEEDSSDTSSIFLADTDVRSEFANCLGSTTAKTLKWNIFVVDWVAYSGDSFSSGDDLDVIIVLADSKALGLVTTSTPSINFNHTIYQLASAIEKGKLPLQVDGCKICVKSLALCSDKSCSRIQTLAWNGAAKFSTANFQLFGVITILLVYQVFM